MHVQLYKFNKYKDTEIKGYVKGVKSSPIYSIRAVMLCVSKVFESPLCTFNTSDMSNVAVY